MRKIIQLYKNAYGGLSPAAWMLSVVMLINRSGSMVMPFLSVYLTKELGYDVEKAGVILGIFGLGAMAGSYLGGWLTDKIGQFKVQFLSLTLGGLMFYLLSVIRTYELLAVYIFLVSMVVDSLRPANSASVAMYAKPENVTRAFSLNRMAVNLGFSFGPALGGLLAAYSYYWLFMVDGTTCLLAGLLFFFYFKNRKANKEEVPKKVALSLPIKKGVWYDGRFLLFCICVVLFGTSFFQLFFTLPLYYREIYGMSETSIGLLLGLNGLVVFIFEMIIVYMIGNKIQGRLLIILGSLLTGAAYLLLNLVHAPFILYISVLVVSFGEIFAMPYMITYTTERAGPKTRGSYMGLYSLTFATAFVVAPILGTRIIAFFNFEMLWWIIGGISAFTALAFYLIIKPGTAPAPTTIKTAVVY
jgi:predicted MFS family arabinose efflux permease